jgi:hypothetical protein
MRHALALLVASVASWPSLAAAHGHPDAIVAGTLTTEVVACPSLCTESDWIGRLDGTSSFSLISMEDEQIPGENVSRFHGNLTLSTAHGELIGQDLGVWNLDSGQYIDVYTVTSGTEDYAGATGVILLWGTLDPVTGQGISRYQGVLTWRAH